MRRTATCLLVATALLSPGPGTTPARAAPAEPPLAAPPVPSLPDAGLPDELANQLEDAMARLAEQTKRDALAKLEERDYPAALELLTRAHAIDGDDPEINHRLGRLHMLLGQRAEAEQHLRHALALDVGGTSAAVALADLLSEPPATEPGLVEAASLLRSARLHAGRDPQIVVRQARVAAARGHFDEAQRFYADHRTLNPAIDNPLRLELGDFHRDRGHKEEAFGWYRQVDGGDPAIQRLAAQRIFELSAQREAEHLALASQSPEVVRRARQQVTQARMLTAEGQLGGAAQLLGSVIAVAPLFAPARAALADVAAARGDQSTAERGYLRAIVLGAGEGQTYASLGTLYARWRPRPRNAEATVMLQRALQSRPDLSALHRLLAECLRATGDLPRALLHARAYLAAATDEPTRRSAQDLVQQLEGVVGGDGHVIDLLDTAPSTAAALARARTHLGAGATDAALAELRALTGERSGIEVLNLEARILIAAGRDAEAREALRRSLQLDAGQSAIHAALGRLLSRTGEVGPGLTHLVRAEQLGDLDALVEVVASRAGPDDALADIGRMPALYALRSRLDDSRFTHAPDATRRARGALVTQLDTRLLRGLLSLLAAVALLVALLGLWLWRRSGGVGLATLTELHPETSPQVERILLSLRHEVLKHNTTMLTGLIASLQRAQPDRELARHLSEALFGSGAAGDSGGTGGALDRLDAYTQQLVQLARSHGLRLNLPRRDEALSEILWGFGRLRSARRQLEALGQGRGRGRRLLSALRDANAAINERGYEQLQALLEELQVFHVDAAALRGIFDAVRREPSIAALTVAELQLETADALPCPLRIARHDFDDILTNLFRNAIQSSARSLPAGETIAIGLEVNVEVDDITGLEQAQLRVRDASTEELTTETLRHQAIERGLGLTADRVNRYDGSLHVEPETGPPWTKAVVLGLPVSP